MPDRQWLSLPVIVAALVIVSLVGILSYYLLFRETSDKDIPVATTSNITGQERVFVADLYEYVGLETKESIERTLYDSIDRDKPDLYTGTIREGSFTKTTTASSQTISNLLIDVEPIKITYEVTLFGQQGRPSINVDCAPQEQQLVPSNECKDIHHHE